MTFWSEVPAARARELAADIATWAWVGLWAVIAFRLYSTIAGFAEVGRTVGRGGSNIQGAGRQIGESLSGLPIVGQQVRGLAESAFASAGEPFVFVGGQIEDLMLLLAALLGLLVVGLALIPWLSRYLPWRARRLAELRSARRAIRLAPLSAVDADLQRLIATRAIHRLSYGELLEHTADPLGDFLAGRYEDLARAELASVGLRPETRRPAVMRASG